MDRPNSPAPKRGGDPQFSAHICCGLMAGWIRMSLGMEVGLGPGDLVLDGDPVPPSRARIPVLNVRPIRCCQTAGWIKMALGTEVGVGPGHIVLHRDQARLPKKGAEPPPQFSVHFYCDQTAGCIKMPLSTEVGLSPGDFVLDGDTATPRQKGAETPNFRPMSSAAKRMHGSRCNLVRT